MEKSYTVKEYVFGKTCVRYTIMNDTQKVFMNLLPVSADAEVCDNYKNYSIDNQFTDHVDWYAGAIAHIHLSHHTQPPYCDTCKLGQSYKEMYFKSQDCTEYDDRTVVKTVMTSDEGYDVIHKLTHRNGDEAFIVETTFVNTSDRDFKLEMISSAALDGLTPYSDTEHSKELNIHVFKSGWATEGKHKVYTLSELNLEKAWGGNYSNFKIGTIGVRATIDYFPFAAVEDRKHNVMWGMTLVDNGTWQMDFSRYGRDISFTCGIGDKKYSNWWKVIKSGESFTAPKAYIAAVNGDIADLSDVMLRMREDDINAYGEEGMPIVFNEWCTTWGNPTHKGNVEIAKKLKSTKVKYFVMDDGWYNGAIGDWEANPEKFPQGLKPYTDEIRSMGFIPGIWMEFECSNEGSKYFTPKYDHLRLKYDNSVIVGQVGLGRVESIWDLRNPEAVEHLKEIVIKFLKNNGFGYLKVDYNCDIGMACDGEESEGEEFRKYTNSIADFFRLIKKEIPDIIIENCSSGGMRLDPVMTGITAMSSFSDAHECFEFPIIGANLQYLLPPCQSQIWCVMKPEFDENRFAFTISAGFLGRICWSGDIAGLSESQIQEMCAAENFYDEVSGIVRHGKSIVYRTEDNINFRYPEGTQAVLRYADDGERALLVYHTFDNPKQLNVPVNGDWVIEKSLYDAKITVANEIVIDEAKAIFGNVVLLKRADNKK